MVVSLFAVMLTACDQSTSPSIAGVGGSSGLPPGNVSNNTAALVITPSHVQLIVGATSQLSTNASASLQSQVQWGSLKSTVATVSPSGLVTAVGVGTTIITARYSFDSARVATATIDVTAGATNTGSGGMTGGMGIP
jgi:Bacterial Ig-like domain (group 2).